MGSLSLCLDAIYRNVDGSYLDEMGLISPEVKDMINKDKKKRCNKRMKKEE
jgi:hypothetical protein